MGEHPRVKARNPLQATVIRQYPLDVIADARAFEIVNREQAGCRQLPRGINQGSWDVPVGGRHCVGIVTEPVVVWLTMRPYRGSHFRVVQIWSERPQRFAGVDRNPDRRRAHHQDGRDGERRTADPRAFATPTAARSARDGVSSTR